jgi:antitoxin (DNA-binding transcriptional repressor) of toxin-antitoxin stability system
MGAEGDRVHGWLLTARRVPVTIVTMKLVNIAEAKARLSDLVEQAVAGEQVVLCKRNEPVAEIRALPARRTAARPLGLSPGSATLLPGFFEPLAEEFIAAFEHPADGLPGGSHSRVAEPRPHYGPPGPARTPRVRKRR